MYNERSDRLSAQKMLYSKFETLFCEIILIGNQQGLAGLRLNIGKGKQSFRVSEAWSLDDAFFADTIDQLREYLRGERQIFNLCLNPQGTAFQQQVWRQLSKIPYGQLCSYKDIAQAIGNEKASRAVGMANSKNPIPLIIPCHRVIGVNGKLTGFAHGIAVKEKLIDFEQQGLAKGLV